MCTQRVLGRYDGARQHLDVGSARVQAGGAAAAAFPGATGAGLKALLLRTVDPKPSLAGVTTTEGRLNRVAQLTCVGSPKTGSSPRGRVHVALNDRFR